MQGVILVNEDSGNGRMDVEELRRLFDAAVHALRPDDLEAAVTRARDAGAPFVGAAGGDGTARLVAACLAGTSTALLPLPGGTRNHLARDLGVTDIEAAASASGSNGRRRTIALGKAGDEWFVNTASIGLYPRMVARREALERHLPKPLANLAAAWHQLVRGRRLTLEVDGQPFVAWMFFVGNGRYGEGPADVASRETVGDGELDIRILRADRRLARCRVALALVTGRLARSPLLVRWRAAQVTVDVVGRDRTPIALDGEVEEVASPLQIEAVHDALTVLVPDEREAAAAPSAGSAGTEREFR